MIDPNAIIAGATTAYNSAVAGYKAQLAAQQQQQAGVLAGYNELQKGVLGGLEESSAVAGKQISDQYAQNAAKNQMTMFRQGLGNSTTRLNMLNQMGKDQAFAQTDRTAKYASLAADKRTQLGLQGLGYAGNAIDANSRFASQGLQYAGQGALGVANLAQGFAGMQLQQEMQDKSIKAQMDRDRLSQYYGAGRGGGGGGNYGSPANSGFKFGGGSGGGGYRPPQLVSLDRNGPGGAAATAASPSTLYPSQNYNPYDPADSFYSGLEGQALGGGTMGDGYSYADSAGGYEGDGWLYQGRDY